MTDVIFLLLIFFMITSTVVSPNAIKVLLPQGKEQTSAKPLTRVIIDKELNMYAAFGNDAEQAITMEEFEELLALQPALTAEDMERMVRYLRERDLKPGYVDVRVEGKAFYK